MNQRPVTKLLLKGRRLRAPTRLALLISLIVLGLAGVAVAESVTSGEIGPSLHLTGNGHLLHPGRPTDHGRRLPDRQRGRAGRPRSCGSPTAATARTTSRWSIVASGSVIQTLPLPGCYGGVAFAPDGRHAYVSGTPTGSSPTEGPTKGDQGDVIHIFTVDPSTGQGVEGDPAAAAGHERRQRTHQLAAAGVRGRDGAARGPGRLAGRPTTSSWRSTGPTMRSSSTCTRWRRPSCRSAHYPEGVAFDPQGRAYVSNEYDGTLSVIDPASAKVTATITGLGGALGDLASHPEGMVADPQRPAALRRGHQPRPGRGRRHDARDQVTHLVSVARPQGLGTAPTNLAISPDDGTLYSSDAGEDAVAAISLAQRPSTRDASRARRSTSPLSLKTITAYRSQRAKAARRWPGPTGASAARSGRSAALAAPRAMPTAPAGPLRRARRAARPLRTRPPGAAGRAPPLRQAAALPVGALPATAHVDRCAGPSLAQEKLYVDACSRPGRQEAQPSAGPDPPGAGGAAGERRCAAAASPTCPRYR